MEAKKFKIFILTQNIKFHNQYHMQAHQKSLNMKKRDGDDHVRFRLQSSLLAFQTAFVKNQPKLAHP